MTTRRRLPNLNALRAFEAAARRLSISLAADELCVTQSAVSRQIKALEGELGVLLFVRLTRAIQLTEQGRDYLLVVRDTFDRIEQATKRLRVNSERKVLTVSVLPTFAMEYLIPRLMRFNAEHPNIEVRIVASIEPVDFESDDVDVAIRVGKTPDATTGHDIDKGPRIDLQMVSLWATVRAELLMPDVLVPVCSKEFLERYGPFDVPSDLLGKPLLHNATRSHAWPDLFSALGLQKEEASRGASYGHFFMAMQAAEIGLGLALVPEVLTQAAIATGRLVRLSNFHVPSAGAYYILCRAYQWENDSIRQFREWLLADRDSADPFPSPSDKSDTVRVTA